MGPRMGLPRPWSLRRERMGNGNGSTMAAGFARGSRRPTHGSPGAGPATSASVGMQWWSSRSSIASIPKSRDVNELSGSNSLGCKRTPFIATSTNATTPTTTREQFSPLRRRPLGWTKPKPPSPTSFKPAEANAPLSQPLSETDPGLPLLRSGGAQVLIHPAPGGTGNGMSPRNAGLGKGPPYPPERHAGRVVRWVHLHQRTGEAWEAAAVVRMPERPEPAPLDAARRGSRPSAGDVMPWATRPE